MEDKIAYDPKTKGMIKSHIYDFLYGPVDKDFANRLKSIIIKNSLALGNSQQWVCFKGAYYSYSHTGLRPVPMNRLRADLYPLMKDYLAEVEEVNNTEMPYVLGFVNQVLNSSDSIQDYLRMFPPSTHKPIKDIIDKCVCSNEHLKQSDINKIQKKNLVPIELMKKRMVLNLLI
jgi:hypothetical protein